MYADFTNPIDISYCHFITQFVFCQLHLGQYNTICVILVCSFIEFAQCGVFSMEFNECLRYLIDCEEIKIKDLAPKLLLAPSTLGNYVQGTREPDYDTLRRIADYFGVSIDYLLGHKTPAEDDADQRHSGQVPCRRAALATRPTSCWRARATAPPRITTTPAGWWWKTPMPACGIFSSSRVMLLSMSSMAQRTSALWARTS